VGKPTKEDDMPTRDETRWKQNDDGSWSRTVGGVQETTAVNPNATAGAQEIAEELGVDLTGVSGSGKGGRITKADVEAVAS
jgi:pyruvate/2-oxoglutarate dehydrogenase complex dihydrolipoamide acyltransferase (E2) component